MSNKEWKEVVLYGKGFLVSSDGDVTPSWIKTKTGKIRYFNNPPKKQFINDRGYSCISINTSKSEYGAKSKTIMVHRLVCMAFHPNPENKPQVNHKDCNQLNNKKDNLEWATAKENTQHAIANGLIKRNKRVLTDEEEDYILSHYYTTSIKEISRKISYPIQDIYAFLAKKNIKLKGKFKKVVDTSTMKVYFSIQEAAQALNMIPRKLNRMLSGERINKTSFRYANQDDCLI